MVMSFRKYLSESEIDATKRKGIAHLNQMKPLEFLDLLRVFKDEFGGIISSENVDVSEKVDGFGVRFGYDGGGRFFLESSHSGPQFSAGAFSAYAVQKYGVSNNISKGYDDIFDVLSKMPALKGYLTKVIPGGCKVIGECLYNPNGTLTDHGIKFIATTYDPKLLGKWATFVIFDVIPVDSKAVFDKNDVIEGLARLSTAEVKFAKPSIGLKNVDISYEIDDFMKLINNYDNLEDVLKSRKAADRELKKAIIDIFEKFQKEVTEKIADGLLSGQFGPEIEGAVFNMKTGQSFKITTDTFKANKAEFNTAYKGKP